MANFDPVHTLAELDALDEEEMREGYRSAERGDPEPGHNRGRAFWHGWRCRMFDLGELRADEGHRGLVRAWVARERIKAPAAAPAPPPDAPVAPTEEG